jgi:lambda repressor-like predicted transcriptional regulator
MAMKYTRTRLLATGAAVLTLAGLGAAAAGGAQAHPGKARAFQARALHAAAKYFGETPAQLRKELPGHSLAQLATAKGKSVDDLEAAIVAPFRTKLDKRQAAGKVTTARAQTVLAALQTRVEAFVNRVFGQRAATTRPAKVRLAPGAFRRIALRESAEFLGLTRKELRTQLKGTSLAALATAKGKSVADLEAAILKPLADRLGKAQANGRLSTAQQATLLQRLTTRVDAFVHRTFR